jgi:hypothetical protein
MNQANQDGGKTMTNNNRSYNPAAEGERAGRAEAVARERFAEVLSIYRNNDDLAQTARAFGVEPIQAGGNFEVALIPAGADYAVVVGGAEDCVVLWKSAIGNTTPDAIFNEERAYVIAEVDLF